MDGRAGAHEEERTEGREDERDCRAGGREDGRAAGRDDGLAAKRDDGRADEREVERVVLVGVDAIPSSNGDPASWWSYASLCRLIVMFFFAPLIARVAPLAYGSHEWEDSLSYTDVEPRAASRTIARKSNRR